MALNKYMHPRNIYKSKKTNFEKLALKYPEFGKYVFPDVTGKLFLDFKHNESLRQLTVTLLKDDFNLNVDLPLNRLIPTIPLRLNYIHWIEDMVNNLESLEHVAGVDIGAGASCIYPLLSCTLNKEWKFLATEIDALNCQYAQSNIERNDLDKRIQLKSVAEGTVLLGAVDETEKYTFSMCNPPFFADHTELQMVKRGQHYSQGELGAQCTTGVTESIVKGGEQCFILQMIEESQKLRDTIRIFTSMVGKKSSLSTIKQKLKSVKDVRFAVTEFCQGKTMRWGIAWTFDSSFTFPISPFHAAKQKQKQQTPISVLIPGGIPDVDYTVKAVAKKIQALLAELRMDIVIKTKQEKLIIMKVTAHENTWTHQRRKRREQARKRSRSSHESPDSNDNKKLKIDSKCVNTVPCEIDIMPVASLSKSSMNPIGSEKLVLTNAETNKKDSDCIGIVETDKAKLGTKNNELQTQVLVDKDQCKQNTESTGSDLREMHACSQSTSCSKASECHCQGNEQPSADQSQRTADSANIKRKDKCEGDTHCDQSLGQNLTSAIPIQNDLTTQDFSLKAACQQGMLEPLDSRMCDAMEGVEEGVLDQPYLIKFSVKVKTQGHDIYVDMALIDGPSKDLVHQILQFLKNRLKPE